MRKLIVLILCVWCLIPISLLAEEAGVHRFANYNIRFVNSSNGDTGQQLWANRRQYVVKIVTDYDFDIVGMEEVTGNNKDATTGKSQLQDLRDMLTGYADYSVERTNSNYSYNSIFYKTAKYTLLDKGRFYVNEHPETPGIGWEGSHARTCIWVHLRDNASQQDFYFACTHQNYGGTQSGIEGAKLVGERISQLAGQTPVVLVGDFNMSRSSHKEAYQGYSSHFYDLALTAPANQCLPADGPQITATTTGWTPAIDDPTGNEFDYIFYDHMKPLSRHIITQYYPEAGRTINPSDHYPVLGRFRLGSIFYATDAASLQTALSNATMGNEIRVQAGTYYGNFQMKEGVNVSGGWDANFETQTDYASILDAQENGRVLEQPANFTTLTIWSNFTIQNGKLTAISATPANGLGAGVALGKKGQVKHCLIQNNTFSYNGNCMGGGVGNDAVDAATDVCAEDCWIRNNSGTHGGGARVRGTLLNCVIENNNTNNSVKKGPAGGVHLQAGRMVGCIVRGNLSGGDTGGVRLYGKSQLINCLIEGNTATNSVGGISIESANSDVIGCTVVNNEQQLSSATVSKCGIACASTTENGTKLANNIVWGNKHNGVAQTAQVYYISHYAAANRVYNAIAHQNTTNGIKLSMDNDKDDTYTDGDSNEQTGRAPHFADPANGDYRLTRESPMVNKGLDEVTSVNIDLDGNARIAGDHVDIGAYELLLDYPTSSDNVQRDNDPCVKVIRNGQLIILRDGKEYTILGQ